MSALLMSTVSAQVLGGLMLGSTLVWLAWDAHKVRTRLDKLEAQLEAMSMTAAAELV